MGNISIIYYLRILARVSTYVYEFVDNQWKKAACSYSLNGDLKRGLKV